MIQAKSKARWNNTLRDPLVLPSTTHSARCFLGLDIAPNKANSPLCKKAIDAVGAAPRLYKPPTSGRLSNDILDALHNKYRGQQRDYLEQSTGLGRAITGDGATILGNKLINFLCPDRMKETMLISKLNRNRMLEDGAKVETPCITKELLGALGRVEHMILLPSV